MGSKASAPNCLSRRWEVSMTASPIRLRQRVRLRAIDSRPSRLPGKTQGSRNIRIRVGTGRREHNVWLRALCQSCYDAGVDGNHGVSLALPRGLVAFGCGFARLRLNASPHPL